MNGESNLMNIMNHFCHLDHILYFEESYYIDLMTCPTWLPLEKPQDEPPPIIPYQGDIYTEVENTGLFSKGEETAAEAEYGTVAGKVSILGSVHVDITLRRQQTKV